MPKKTVITSFTEKGYQQYGKKFIETFRQHWPDNVELVVFYEGTNLRDGWRTINEVKNLENWMRVIAPFQIMSGSLFDQYSIEYDARTNRVIFMQNHALRKFKGKVFWIDGDVITHSKVPETFLDEVLPDDKMCCFLGRDGWYDSETGFIGFNYDHPECEHFLKIEENTLFSGIIFTQHRWWDMVCFDWSRTAFCAQSPEKKDYFVDLAKDLPRGTMHVFVNSVVGAYMDHLKGKRKGKTSYAKDLVVERPEPYWQAIINGSAPA
jgi:hypothetical protein